MKEEIEIKVEHFEMLLLTRFQTSSFKNLDEFNNRDFRDFFRLNSLIRSWISDYNLLKGTRSDELECLVQSFFKDEDCVFNKQIQDILESKLLSLNINELSEFINEFTEAVAYEKLRVKLFETLLRISPNE
jgi:hypothetical protein